MLDFGLGFHEIDACPPRNLAGESAYIAVALEIGRDGAFNILSTRVQKVFQLHLDARVFFLPVVS